MSLERLWSPWRLAYVSGSGEPKGCVFCDAQVEEHAAPLLLFRGTTCFVILNLFPYNNGHLMVVPNRHVATLALATPDELNEMMRLTRAAEMAVTEAYRPQGINVGMNLGRPAPASRTICTSTSSPGGPATRISCRWSETCGCCPRTWSRPGIG